MKTSIYIAARIAASAAGLLLLAISAHVTVTKSGGYAEPGSLLILAITVGIAIGAFVLGLALAEGRRWIAVAIGAFLVCGEVFAFLQSGERIIAAREAGQVPLRQALERHEKAKERVSRSEAATVSAPATSARLEAAERVLRDANAAVAKEAAKPGCRQNCRVLLQQAVDAAAGEVRAARADQTSATDAAQRAADAEREAARAELAVNPMPASSTALADRLGVSPTALDLLVAALGGFAINGLAAALLAYASHSGWAHAAPARLEETEPEDDVGNGCRVREWLSQATERQVGSRVPVGDLFNAYQAWARVSGVTERTNHVKFGRALIRCNVAKSRKGGKVFALDLSLVARKPALRVVA